MSQFLAAFGLLIGNPIAVSLVITLRRNNLLLRKGFAGGAILLGRFQMLMALIIRARQVNLRMV